MRTVQAGMDGFGGPMERAGETASLPRNVAWWGPFIMSLVYRTRNAQIAVCDYWLARGKLSTPRQGAGR